MKKIFFGGFIAIFLLAACTYKNPQKEDTYTVRKQILIRAIDAKLNEQRVRLGHLDSLSFVCEKQLKVVAESTKDSLKKQIAVIDSEKIDAQHRIKFFLVNRDKVKKMGIHQLPQ